MEHLKVDIRAKFEDSRLTFADTDSEDKEYLQLFAFFRKVIPRHNDEAKIRLVCGYLSFPL